MSLEYLLSRISGECGVFGEYGVSGLRSIW